MRRQTAMIGSPVGKRVVGFRIGKGCVREDYQAWRVESVHAEQEGGVASGWNAYKDKRGGLGELH